MLHKIRHFFTIYSTTRQVKIKSNVLAFVYIFVVIIVWTAFLTSLNLNLKNIYQKSCPVEGAVSIKIKGDISTENLTNVQLNVENPELYKRVWDSSDLVFPSYGEDGGVIIATNMIITPNQTLGVCSANKKESNEHKLSNCVQDEDCKRGRTFPTLGGIMTGACDKGTNSCQLSTWCPLENNALPMNGSRALLEEVQDFTILIKNSVEFPECRNGIHERNILANASSSYLSECLYSPNAGKDESCPIFKLVDIVKWSGSNFSKVALTGGIFRITLNWDCDFDFGNEKCRPKYIFERIDDEKEVASPGWNFRIPYYHEENRRTLTKVYALKILVITSGEGKQFDFLKMVLNVGATIALFDLAPLICDSVFHFLCFLRKCSPFRQHFEDFSSKAIHNDRSIEETG